MQLTTQRINRWPPLDITSKALAFLIKAKFKFRTLKLSKRKGTTLTSMTIDLLQKFSSCRRTIIF